MRIKRAVKPHLKVDGAPSVVRYALACNPDLRHPLTLELVYSECRRPARSGLSHHSILHCYIVALPHHPAGEEVSRHQPWVYLTHIMLAFESGDSSRKDQYHTCTF
jgi:hypothetical protein